MFVEETLWIQGTLAQLELDRGTIALDAGSSTLGYRRETQPHIERNIAGPLRERGIEVRSLDVRAEPGVDYVCDLTASDFDPMIAVGRRFELVLCNNVLVHLRDPRRGAANVSSLVAPGGWLLASTPSAYRRVRDPLDNGLRPEPAELVKLLIGAAGSDVRFVPETQASVRIDQRSYYRSSPVRPSWFPLRGHWLPLPGAVEQVRYLVHAWRWRVACVLLRRIEAA